MYTTSATLLGKLREPNQSAAWARFVDLYTPLLFAWARRAGLQTQDAADLVQDVFTSLLTQMPKFQYDPAKKNFRGWLRTVCLNRWRNRKRGFNANLAQAETGELAAVPADADLEAFLDQEHHRFVVRQAFQLMEELKGEFDARTLEAFREFVVNERPAAEVAEQFGITANAVYIAKLRVMRRLRQELEEFLE